MSAKLSPRVPTHPKLHTRTQGIALVVVLLAAMVLMVSLLGISSTMTISAQRTTADQGVTLQAQYAAESGLAYAQARFTEAQALFPLLEFERTVGRTSIKAAIDDYCGGSAPSVVPTLPIGSRSVRYCDVRYPSASRTFAIFANYITSTAKAESEDIPYLRSYPTASLSERQSYWRDMFAGNISRPSVATAAPDGTSATYQVKYGFTATKVDVINMGYRIFFSPVAIESTGNVSANNKIVASRKLQATVSVPEFSIDISRDSFSNYNYFVNRRVLPSALGGGKLNFSDNDSFEGRVHINASGRTTGAAWFNNSTSSAGARFHGGFTSAQTSLYWTNATGDPSKMFPGGYKLGADVIDLPPNATSQRRAVINGNSEDTSSLGVNEIPNHYGKTASNFSNGIYYGSGQQEGNTWGGGIYVKGNVDDLKLATKNNLQVITIKQTTGTLINPIVTVMTFTQTSLTERNGTTSSSWAMSKAVTASGKTTTTNTTISNGNFNGLVYVEGNIGDSRSHLDGYGEGLGGEGTSDQLTAGTEKEIPDIAPKSQLTVAASGDIFVKRNLTYTDDPTKLVDDPTTPDVDESARNVLGIYSEGGNVKVDGAVNKNIKVHASIMAVGKDWDITSTLDGHGFGTTEYSRDRKTSASVSPSIELLGGIIEEQSQGVGQTGSKYELKCNNGRCGYELVATKGGYTRSFNWDKRYDTGFTPPYFPTQLKFTRKCQEGDPTTTAEPINCARNTPVTWVIQQKSGL